VFKELWDGRGGGEVYVNAYLLQVGDFKQNLWGWLGGWLVPVKDRKEGGGGKRWVSRWEYKRGGEERMKRDRKCIHTLSYTHPHQH
jgi:hypothetical protein